MRVFIQDIQKVVNVCKDLGTCARYAQEWGYDEVNLNCGCPSDRVQSGMFGACLMARPELVAECVRAMVQACDIPVTVKHRIGIDDMESYGQPILFLSVSRRYKAAFGIKNQRAAMS